MFKEERLREKENDIMIKSEQEKSRLREWEKERLRGVNGGKYSLLKM